MNRKILSIAAAAVSTLLFFGRTIAADAAEPGDMQRLPGAPAHSHDMSVDCGGDSPLEFARALTSEEGKLYIDGVECGVVDVNSYQSDGLSNSLKIESCINLPAGSYYLEGDVTLAKSINIAPGVEVNLCLNGHTLKGEGAGDNVIRIGASGDSAGKLSFCDCSEAKTGTITGDTVSGIYFYATLLSGAQPAILNMYGGTISGIDYSDPESTPGAAVSLSEPDPGAEFHMYGGRITGNTAIGVNAYTGALFLSGGADISGNGSAYSLMIKEMAQQMEGAGFHLGNINSNIDIGVLIDQDTGDIKKLQIEGALDEGNKSSVFMMGLPFSGTFTVGWSACMDGKSPADYFISAADAFEVALANNEAVIRTPVHSHDMSVDCGHSQDIAFGQALTSQNGKLYINGIAKEPGDTYLDLPEGDYYLADGLVLANTVRIQGTVNLCLNGKTLDMGEKNIRVAGEGKLRICDCAGGGTVTSAYYTSSRNDALIRVSGEFSLYGGKVVNTSDKAHNFTKALSAVSGTVGLYGGEAVSLYDSAVYFDNQGSAGLTLSGAPRIQGADGKADIYLRNDSVERHIALGEPLTGTETYRVAADAAGVFTAGWGTHMSDKSFSDFFTGASKGLFICEEDGELALREYAITGQPSKDNDYTVEANGAPDYAPRSYQWYAAQVTEEEVTDQNAQAGSTMSGTSSYDSAEGWTGTGSDGIDRYFSIRLLRGDVIKVKPSAVSGDRGQFFLEADALETFYSRETDEDGWYILKAPADANYTVGVDWIGGAPKIRATAVKTVLGEAVEGQNDRQFTGEGDGSWLCQVEYADGTVLRSNIITHSHVFDREAADENALKSPADCTHAAVYYKSCSCGEISSEDADTFSSGSALGHAYTEKITDDAHLKKAAENCQEHDAYWYDCARCDANAREDAAASDKWYESETVGSHDYDTSTWYYREAEGHAHKCRYCDAVDAVLAHTPGAAATETTAQTCTECGYILAPALGHTCSPEAVEKAEPTCADAGKEKYYRCAGCGKNYEDAEGTIEIADLAAWGNLAALGHAYTEKITDDAHLKKAAENCQEHDAYWYDCARCDANAREDAAASDKWYESETVGSHDYDTSAWAYREAEGHAHKCRYCDAVDAVLAHTEDAGTVTKKPTDKETGTKTYKCSVCGRIMRTESLPAIGGG